MSQIIHAHKERVLKILSVLTSNLSIIAISLNLLSLPHLFQKWDERAVKEELSKLSATASPIIITERGEELYRSILLRAEKIYKNI
ncbi:hypothetical protein [Herbaspirillum huttiense]|uniref:hypothetical protein n=1 Tax=Herbaspirillum huttiense TaxID=863372 RepID=UPI0039B0D074